MANLSDSEKARYNRQISIEGIGERGQEKLKAARVAIIGAGGLGSAVSIYLAVAGIGFMKIIDFDIVELSNLNRQILHWEQDIGKYKVDSALQKLRNMNSDIEIVGLNQKIDENNAVQLLKDVDAVVDCLDNFTTRSIINDAVIHLEIPLFHGACFGFEGRATTIVPHKTPCLRCIMPEIPPEQKSPIMGVAPGVIGNIQATELIKYFIGIEPNLQNKLLLYNGQSLTYKLINVLRDENCPACGKGGTR